MSRSSPRWLTVKDTRGRGGHGFAGAASPHTRAALLLTAAGLACTAEIAHAAVGPQTTSGPPQQVIPTYLETGVPSFTIQSGQPTAPTTGSGSNGGSGSVGGTSAGGNSQALGTMLSQSWGGAAANNAQAIGVNAAALAATCVLESGCRNVGAQGGSTVSGAFQMTNGTYTSDLNAALAADPDLAGQVTQGLAGKMDPATEALAAAQDLKTAALSLQQSDIANPTVMDVRGYYNFGAAYGTALAQASDDQSMSAVLSGYSASQLAANGISATTTVGQWRQSVVSKIGSTANVPVLTG